MKNSICIPLFLVVAMLAGELALADKSVRLRVTATIPPKPCQYPQNCAPKSHAALQANATRATVSPTNVTYLGSRPRVEDKNGVRTVVF